MNDEQPPASTVQNSAPPPGPELRTLADDALYVVRELARGAVPLPATAVVADQDVRTITRVASDVQNSKPVSIADESELGLSLSRVLKSVAPITLQSLKDTDPNLEPRRSPIFLLRTYEANHLSYSLVFWTIIFVAIASAGEFMSRFYGEPLDQTEGWTNGLGILLQNLTPFTYGAMGACVYLLRSLHKYIADRTFERRRRPEYVNRVLLGSVSGGAMVLLVDQVTTDSGDVIHFSSAALGFLAGYSTDLLFSAIERIIAAILPRVGLDSVRRRAEPEAGATPAMPSVTELLDRYAKAGTDQEKAIIKELLDRVKPPADNGAH